MCKYTQNMSYMINISKYISKVDTNMLFRETTCHWMKMWAQALINKHRDKQQLNILRYKKIVFDNVHT